MRPGALLSRSVLVLTTVLFLSASAASTIAQTITNPDIPTTTIEAKAKTGASAPHSGLNRIKIGNKNRSTLQAYNDAAWQYLVDKKACIDQESESCAVQAVMLANSTCSASALLFQKGSSGWAKLQFALVLASAAFTGVGAAATIDGSTTVPKVFSTLGGASGLGAVLATTNSDISNSEAGIAAVNSYQAQIQNLASPVKGDSPDNEDIFLKANSLANQCVAANPSGATASTGGTTKPANNGTTPTPTPTPNPTPAPTPSGGAPTT